MMMTSGGQPLPDPEAPVAGPIADAAEGAQEIIRLVALAVVSDGRIADEELDLLGGRMLDELGASMEDFCRVLDELRRALAGVGNGAARQRFIADRVAASAAALHGAASRERAMRLMFDVVRSDGRVEAFEGQLLWRVADLWDVLPDGAPRRRFGRRRRACARGKARRRA